MNVDPNIIQKILIYVGGFLLALILLFLAMLGLVNGVAITNNIFGTAPQAVSLSQSTSTISNEIPTITVSYKTITLPAGQKIKAELAITPEQQQKGLMGRTTLAPDQAMLFIFDSPQPLNFWMKNTLIPLDIVFLDQDKKIINFFENTTPNNEQINYGSNGKAKYVIEFAGGSVKKYSLEKNQVLEWE